MCIFVIKLIIAYVFHNYVLQPRGGYDYFLLLHGKSSVWFTKKHFSKLSYIF